MTNRNNKLWIFNAGNSFNGNPKWLFLYVNNHREDIDSYWICDDIKTIRYIRKLGYKATLYNSRLGLQLQKEAGVYVVNQVKENFPDELLGVKILNLWHGVGCKSIERKLRSGVLSERVAKKYIKYHQILKNYQMFLVTSPLMEKHFMEHCGIDKDKVIRAGYPACLRQKDFSSFDHNILKSKGLDSDTKIVVYSPTFRENSLKDFFGKAMTDMDLLVKTLKKNNMLLIFKMHPFMEKDYEYNLVKRKYQDNPNLLFWDAKKDFYEILDQIDLAIVDYSSIFYDMLAAGVPHFIRYIFDYDDKENVRDFVFDYKEMTFGKIANNFDELISILGDYESNNEQERERIKKLFWDYTSDDSLETIVNQALEFKPQVEREFPVLYSFDIFDTLIKRKTLIPAGIFFAIKEKMRASGLEFEEYLIENFPEIRHSSEIDLRVYYKKTLGLRKDNRLEITLQEIYDFIEERFKLNSEQKQFLISAELESEFDNLIPMQENIDKAEQLLSEGEKVVLISDMYLPKNFLQKVLRKVSPQIAECPLYLSSEYGVQKSTGLLYLKVYEELDYNFSKWVHFGDNPKADGKIPEGLGIETVLHEIPHPNKYEKSILSELRSYDSHLIVNLLANFRAENKNEKDYYAYAYVSLYFVPYISWVLQDSIQRGYEKLYFISRDGHYLKIIADAIIKAENLKIRTEYIYGSRKAWRIASFIDAVDEDFYSAFGNLSAVHNYDSLLKALLINNDDFQEIFPELLYLRNMKSFNKETMDSVKSIVKNSTSYKDYLLNKAKKKRALVSKYLKQEINPKEKFAFVEYWGRGYTQDCLTRLLKHTFYKGIKNPFYYARSIYPTDGDSLRFNFTVNKSSLVFIETIFANMPYESIVNYTTKNATIEPVIQSRSNDSSLHKSIEQHLEKFASNYATIKFNDENKVANELFDFALSFYKQNPSDPTLVKNFAHLKDSVRLYEQEKEYAPKLRFIDLLLRLKGEHFKDKTNSIEMSLARSSLLIRLLYVFKKELRKTTLWKTLKKPLGIFKKILRRIF